MSMRTANTKWPATGFLHIDETDSAGAHKEQWRHFQE